MLPANSVVFFTAVAVGAAVNAAIIGWCTRSSAGAPAYCAAAVAGTDRTPTGLSGSRGRLGRAVGRWCRRRSRTSGSSEGCRGLRRRAP
ncbi:hypothetical protein [Streptomyces sp. NBC_01314]|uniref:hypothetical protein n=1 Tax=Streptomyces sp. NBC_01314 TaxID=2903821 RepID=UPI00352C6954